MAEINSNININADTRGAVEAIKELQRQISAFQISLARGNASAQKAARAMQQNLINNIDATGKFNASLTNIKSTTESFTDALERNKLTMGEYFRFAGGASKTFGRSFKREFDVITQVAVERVKDLQTQYISLGRDANGALKAIKIRPLTLDMQDFGVQTQITAQRAQLFNKLIEQGSTNLLNWGKNTQWAGRQLMVGFTVPLTMMGTVAAKTFMEIEQQVIKLRRVYGDFATTVEDTDKMVSSLRTLASEFTKWGVSVEKTMSLAADAAATGKMGADLIDQVTQATRLAVLGQVEQQQALETTMSITNAFGIATEKLASKIDFLNAVENQSVTAIEDLTIAIPKAGPVIKQLGGDVEDLAFFLTAMKEGGINASEGANALKSGLASLINPTDKASEFLGKFGVNIERIVQANKGDVKGLVIDFAKALDTLDPLNRARSIEQLFGKFQFSRLSTLFQNVIRQGSQAERVLGLARSSTEELAIVSERELRKIEESTTYRFQKATADLQAALAPVGEEFLKAVTPFIKIATDILKAFNQMSGGAKQFITNVTLFVGGVGPALIMTIGLVANGVAQLIKFFNGLRNLFSDVDGSTNDLASSTDYMTQAQIEAAAVASSLDQAHNKLVQTFGVEGAALEKLVQIYKRAIESQNAFRGQAGLPETPVDISTGYARGVVSVPGPKGAGDIVPAMLSPGEAVIPAKMTEKYKPLIRGMISGNLPGLQDGDIIGDSNNKESYAIGPGKYAKEEELYDAIRSLVLYESADDKRYLPYGTETKKDLLFNIANQIAMDRADVYRRQEIADMESILDVGGIRSKFISGNVGRGGFEHLDKTRLTVSDTIYKQASEGVPGSEIYGYLKAPILPFDVSALEPLIARVAEEIGKTSDEVRQIVLKDLDKSNKLPIKSPQVSGYGELDLKFNREAMLASNAQVVRGDTLSSSTDDLLKYNARMSKIQGMNFKKFVTGNYTAEEKAAMSGPSSNTPFYEVAIPSSVAGIENIESATLIDSVRRVSDGMNWRNQQVPPEAVKKVQELMAAKGIPLDTSAYNDEAILALLNEYTIFEPNAIYSRPDKINNTFASAGRPLPDIKDINGNPISVEQALKQYRMVTNSGMIDFEKIPGLAQGGLIGQGNVDTSGFSTMYGTTPGNFVTIGGKKYYAKQPIGNEAIEEVISSAITKDLGLSNIPTLQLFGNGIVGSEIIEGLIPSANPELSRWLMQQPDKIAAAKDLLNALTAYNINDVPINAAMGNTDVHANNVKYDPASKRFVNIDTGRNIVSGYKTKASSFLDKPLVLFDANQDSQGIKQRVKSAIESVLGIPLEGSEVAKIYQETGYGTNGTREINVSDATSRLLQMFGLDPTLDVTKPENKQLIKNSISNIKTNPYFADLITQNPELGSILEKEFSNPNSSLVNNLVELLSRAAVINKGGLGELPKFADGVMSVPGPKGAGDIIPAMLSPGEAVIPAGMTKKYKPLIQGMIAGNLPGFMAGTANVGVTPGRRERPDEVAILMAQEVPEFDQFKKLYEAGQITEKMYAAIAADVARAKEFGADMKIVADGFMSAIKQMAEVGTTNVEILKRTARYGVTDLAEIYRQNNGKTPKNVELFRQRQNAAVVSNTEKYIQNLKQNLRPEFSHLDTGVTMSRDEALALIGKDTFNTFSRADQKQLLASQNISFKSGFGYDILGKYNQQMSSGKGAQLSDLLEQFSSDSSGVERWATSVEVGNGNLEELSGGLMKFNKIIRDLMTNISNETGITTFVDSMERVQELGGNALPMDVIAEAALEQLRKSDPETYAVLQKSRNTITELRADGGVNTGVVNRTAGGIPELNNEDFITKRFMSEAFRLGRILGKSGAKSFLAGLESSLEIASPSKKTKEAGEDTGQGAIDGMQEKIPEATQVGHDFANRIIDPIQAQAEATKANEIIDQLVPGGFSIAEAVKKAQEIIDAKNAQPAPAQPGPIPEQSPESKKVRAQMNTYKIARGISYGLTGLSMISSFMPQIGEAAQKVTPSLTAMSTGLSMIPGPWGIVLGLVLATGTVFTQVQEELRKTREEAAELAQSLGTGASALEKYASAAGKATASEIMARRRQEKMTGYSIAPDKRKFGQTFFESEDGKAMLQNVQESIVQFGRSSAIQKVSTQLSTAVISGAITGQQAQSIAYQLGKQLNDIGLTISVSGQLIELVGLKGDKFKNNELQVGAKLTGNIMDELNGVKEELAAIDASGTAFMRGFDKAPLEGKLASSLIDIYSTQQQILDAMELQYQNKLQQLEAEKKYQKATQLTNKFEEKKTKLLEQNKQQLEDAFNINFDSLGNKQFVTLDSFSETVKDFYTSDIGKTLTSITDVLTAIPTLGFNYLTGTTATANTAKLQQLAYGDAVNLPESVTKELTTRVKLQYAGTEDEARVNALLDNVLNNNTAFDVMMKVGLAAGSIELNTLDLFQSLDFGENKGQAYEIVARVSGELGGAAANQIMNLVNRVPLGENAAQLRFDILAMIQGNMSDPIYTQKILDAFTIISNYSNLGNINFEATLSYYTNNPEKLDEFMKKIKQLKNLQKQGKLNIRSIIKQDIFIDTASEEQFKKNDKYFNSLDPINKILYVQTFLTQYQTITDADVAQYRQTEGIDPFEKTDAQVRALMASEDAYAVTSANAANETDKLDKKTKKLGDTVGTTANEFDLLSAKIDVLQKALSIISMKEEKINKKYDKRAEALQEIADLNKDIAQQQQNQLDIADALSRGDIAAAARAVQKYRSDEAALAVQRQQKALEDAREQELARVSFDGNTRRQLEARLRRLEMQMARRDYREAVQYLETRGASALTGGGTSGPGGAGPKGPDKGPGKGSEGPQKEKQQPKEDLGKPYNIFVNSLKTNGEFSQTTDPGAFKYAGYERNARPIRSGITYSKDGKTVSGVEYEKEKKSYEQRLAEYEKFETATKNSAENFRKFWEATYSNLKDNGIVTKNAMNTLTPVFSDVVEKIKNASGASILLKENQDKLGKALQDAGYKVRDGKVIIESNGEKIKYSLKDIGKAFTTQSDTARKAETALNKAKEANKQYYESLGPVGDILREIAQRSAQLAVSKGKMTVDQYERLGFSVGGMIPKYAGGGMIPKYFAVGGKPLGSDTVPAMLTPGEFVIKRAAVQEFGVKNLKAINSGTYGGESVYNYSINVNVSTDANPDQIARAVAQNVKRTENYRLRGTRI